MAQDKYYLTTGPNPKGEGYLAVISLGSPQKGDKNVMVCNLKVVATEKDAQAWYAEQMELLPWETRN